jgi:MYXO-CTERM domain-containing protein
VVWAEGLSEASIMEGVRAGRVVVKLRGPDDPMVELTAETDREESGMIGDTVSGTAVTLTVNVAGGAGMVLDLVRNRESDEIVMVDSDEFTHVFERDVSAEGDRYRVHLREENDDVVITNHVWVDFAPPGGGGGDDAGPGGGGGGGGGGDDDDDGEGGCGCRSGSSGAGSGTAAGLFLLAAVAAGLRRRRSRR